MQDAQVSLNFKIIRCLPEIQIQWGFLYFHLQILETVFQLPLSLTGSLREFSFISSSRRLRMWFLPVQHTASFIYKSFSKFPQTSKEFLPSDVI